MNDGYKNCLSQMGEEQRLGVFENKMLRRIREPKKDREGKRKSCRRITRN
jgi:hypothetical protein